MLNRQASVRMRYPTSRLRNHEILLVTVNRETLYDSGILCQDYGVIQGLPMDHTRFADRITIWVVHLPKQTKGAGLITALDQTVQAMQSCNGSAVAVN